MPFLHALRSLTATSALIITFLLALSSWAWATAIRRFKLLRHVAAVSKKAIDAVQTTQTLAISDGLLASAPLENTPYQRIFQRGLYFLFDANRKGAPGQPALLEAANVVALERILEREIEEERSAMTDGLGWLALLVSVAPLLGLLGTVTGIVTVFAGVQAAGATSLAAIAPGVSEALVTTAAGLIFAIPAAIAHHRLTETADRAEDAMNWFAAEIIHRLIREGQS